MIGWIRKFLHDTLGWHDGKLGPKWSDGASTHAACSQCGREVMQDGQGNWFLR
jgi:hypothetical protein